MNEELLNELRNAGALIEGHFELSSGKHSSSYLQLAKVFESPKLGCRILDEMSALLSDKQADYVVGIEEVGSVLSFGIARRLGIKWLPLRRRKEKRGWSPLPGFNAGDHKFLIVDDITTSGGTLLEIEEALGSKNVSHFGLVGRKASSKFTRSNLSVLIEFPSFDSFDPASCPLCEQNLLLTKTLM